MSLVIAPCSTEAARYAVTKWHYSKTMPVGKVVKYGVWENDDFIGAVLFAWGSNPNLGKAYNLDMTECVELVRVALTEHQCFVSEVVARSLRLLKRDNPGLRLVVSFADPYRQHLGGIYQAGNWIYAGETAPKQQWVMPDRSVLHARAYTGQNFGSAKKSYPKNAQKIQMPPKHRYLYPLDKQMRRKIEPLRLRYPHAVEDSEVSRIASGDEGQVRSLPTALG